MNMTPPVKGRRKTTDPNAAGAGRRLVLLTELVAGATRANAAAKAGISIRTLERWTTEPAFRIELEAARRAAFTEGLAVLRGAVAKAVETLAALLNSKREAERRHAAEVLLSFAFRAHEAGELEARLAALEKTAEELTHRPGGRPF
jgi:hypothetical protein